jgi:hypothetical protein
LGVPQYIIHQYNDKTQPEADPIGFRIHPKMQGTGNMWDATTRT